MLSRRSALVVQDIPVYAVDSRVHFARRGTGACRNGPQSAFHPAVPEDYLAQVDGTWVVAAPWAVLAVAASFGVESGLLSADALLRQHPEVGLAGVLSDFAARVDFLLAEHRVVIEFDGMANHQTPADLRAEKVREDRLRRLGYEVVRLTWKELDDPRAIRALIYAAMQRAAWRTHRG